METFSRYKLRVEIPILAYARWNDVFSLSSFLSHLSSFLFPLSSFNFPLSSFIFHLEFPTGKP